MCGIAGFVGFEQKELLADMANRVQKHRGPDHQAVWSDQHIALAHQRLSIIDLSESANQPFEKGEYVIIFNGEIYNFKGLREGLTTEFNTQFRTSSDTEVVLEMFARYGAACLDKLIGMFAFAIYSKRSQKLFIARDQFGIKPLFYTEINGSFAFSSELKVLVQIPGFNKNISAKSLMSSLNYIWVSGNESMFENCWKLPPAHYLELDGEKTLHIEKYWELDDIGEGFQDMNEGKIVSELEQVMENSVMRHMVSDVPVSSFLSGGLDSSLITSIAKNSYPTLSSYTIGTADLDKRTEQMPDDEKFARSLAKKLELEHHVICINPDILSDLPAMVKTLDEPIGDPAAINTYLICREARKQGVKVLLSGMGADEIFFGYRRQKATLMAQRYHKIPKPIRHVIKYLVDFLPVKIGSRGFKLGRWAKRFLSFAEMPLGESYQRSYSYYSRGDFRQLVKPKYWPAVDEVHLEHQRIFGAKFQHDPINQICHTDTKLFMVGLNLTYTDRASMAASVEVRVPFVDKIVVSKAMQIPGRFKYRYGRSKHILKKAAEKFLPNEIIYRPKASFGAPIRSWISNDLRDLVDDLLSESSIKKRGIFNYDFVKTMIDDDRNGQGDYAYQIYQLLTLELWFRAYLDDEVSVTKESELTEIEAH